MATKSLQMQENTDVSALLQTAKGDVPFRQLFDALSQTSPFEYGAVVSSLPVNAVEEWIDNVTGGMKPKLQAALHALQNGVSPITIGSHPEHSEGPGRPGGTLLVTNVNASRTHTSRALGVTHKGEPNVAA